MIALMMPINGTHYYQKCGGGIIDDQYILTAAHCVINSNYNFKKGPVTILAGINNLHLFKLNDQAVVAEVAKVYAHKFYNATTNVNDIAVLKLKKPLGIYTNENLSKLELPEAHVIYNDEPVIISGFGLQYNYYINGEKTASSNKKKDFIMKYALADIVPNFTCQNGRDIRIQSSHICARLIQPKTGKPEGICKGDSGSPLVYSGKIVIGIVNFGSNSPPCEEDELPAVYARVSSFLKFIKYSLNDNVVSSIVRVHSYL